MKRQMFIVLGSAFLASVALADPYMKLSCATLDKKTTANIDVSPACENSFDVRGSLNSQIEQRCDSKDASIIYTEGSKKNLIVISGAQGTQVAHLVATGKISIRARSAADQDNLLSFAAKLSQLDWQNGKKIVHVTDVNCSGESFENP